MGAACADIKDAALDWFDPDVHAHLADGHEWES
jgi:hypothetical protein